jgi:SpoIIAA-like
MLQSELLQDKGILLITPDGPLEASDFERLTKQIDPFIAANGKLTGVLINTGSFPGWDSFGALLSHLRFVADHHRKIERIAVVTDSGFLKIMPRIAEHFVQAEIKQFGFTEKDRALAWLATG